MILWHGRGFRRVSIEQLKDVVLVILLRGRDILRDFGQISILFPATEVSLPCLAAHETEPVIHGMSNLMQHRHIEVVRRRIVNRRIRVLVVVMIWRYSESFLSGSRV